MGILERLGLRKQPNDGFSEWLGTALEAVFTSGGQSGMSQELYTGLLDLETGIADYVGKRGSEALEVAVDQWVERSDSAVIVSSLTVFLIPSAYRPLLAALQARSGKAPSGIAALHKALDRLGILAMTVMRGDPGYEPEPRTAVYQMLEVIWPFAKTEEALQVRIFELTKSDTRMIKWELYILRTWAFNMVTALAFTDDPARGAAVKATLAKQVEGRAANMPEPAQTADWVATRTAGYSAAIDPIEISGKRLDRVIPVVVGRQFARNFNSTSVELRSIGATVFAEAFAKLLALVQAWKKNP